MLPQRTQSTFRSDDRELDISGKAGRTVGEIPVAHVNGGLGRPALPNDETSTQLPHGGASANPVGRDVPVAPGCTMRARKVIAFVAESSGDPKFGANCRTTSRLQASETPSGESNNTTTASAHRRSL